jgi:hypothetical protein
MKIIILILATILLSSCDHPKTEATKERAFYTLFDYDLPVDIDVLEVKGKYWMEYEVSLKMKVKKEELSKLFKTYEEVIRPNIQKVFESTKSWNDQKIQNYKFYKRVFQNEDSTEEHFVVHNLNSDILNATGWSYFK